MWHHRTVQKILKHLLTRSPVAPTLLTLSSSMNIPRITSLGYSHDASTLSHYSMHILHLLDKNSTTNSHCNLLSISSSLNTNFASRWADNCVLIKLVIVFTWVSTPHAISCMAHVLHHFYPIFQICQLLVTGKESSQLVDEGVNCGFTHSMQQLQCQ